MTIPAYKENPVLLINSYDTGLVKVDAINHEQLERVRKNDEIAFSNLTGTTLDSWRQRNIHNRVILDFTDTFWQQYPEQFQICVYHFIRTFPRDADTSGLLDAYRAKNAYHFAYYLNKITDVNVRYLPTKEQLDSTTF